MPIPSLLKFIVLLFLGLGATLLIGQAYPVFLIATVVSGAFSFKMGKSTRVPLNPRDVPFSPMTILSYREFDRWARENDLRLENQGFFSRTDVHWTEKLAALFSGSDATGHCFEPGRSTTKIFFGDVALGAFIFFPTIREAFVGLSDTGAIFFQFLSGLALGLTTGRATGSFYRWIRGQM